MNEAGDTIDELGTLRAQIKELIVTELDVRDRSAQDIGDEEPLFGSGLSLDSLDALQLAVAIEERFGVSVPEGDESRAIFASVSAIARHIAASK